MKPNDYGIIALLALMALFIWLRDTHWMTSADDTLPILVTLPLFVWLGAPWTFIVQQVAISRTFFALSALLFILGTVTNFILLLTLSWTLLLWSWIKARVTPDRLPDLRKLLILPIMAFPWVTLDAEQLGWWFRLSGAAVAEGVFSVAGLTVIREGTLLTVSQLPISVEPACSGMNTLQSMLIAGSVGAYLQLGNSNLYWWNIPLLAVMAWIANCVRIVLICTAAVFVSPEFAMGSFHDIGGWIVIMMMFGLCWLIFSLQETQKSP